MSDEYIRREDAIIEMIDNNVDHAQGTDGREVVQILEDIPAADVVQVIRCKSCECCEYDAAFEQDWCKLKKWLVKPDGFCSFGKRKGE